MTKALIDADLIAFRCACTCEEDDNDNIVLQRVQDLTERIINNASADSYTLYLTGNKNFRKEISSDYKANRKDKPRPKWLDTCRDHLVINWQAEVTDGIEADDALGSAQTEDSIICSLDKDLLMVTGKHYNWIKEDFTYTTPEAGLKRFWTQMLVGDTADNIFGIKGVGPVKAAKLLDPIEANTIEDLNEKYLEVVSNLYNNSYTLYSNASLLWIMRHETDICGVLKAQIDQQVKIDWTTRESIVASLKLTLLKPYLSMD